MENKKSKKTTLSPYLSHLFFSLKASDQSGYWHVNLLFLTINEGFGQVQLQLIFQGYTPFAFKICCRVFLLFQPMLVWFSTQSLNTPHTCAPTGNAVPSPRKAL